MIARPIRHQSVHDLRAAYHEAGHSAVAWKHGLRILELDMTVPAVEVESGLLERLASWVWEPLIPNSGRYLFEAPPASERQELLPEAEKLVQYLLAGNISLRLKYPHLTPVLANLRYGTEDEAMVRGLTSAFFPDPEEGHLWRKAQARAASRLLREELWEAVETLAQRLQPSTVMSGEEVEAIIIGAIPKATPGLPAGGPRPCQRPVGAPTTAVRCRLLAVVLQAEPPPEAGQAAGCR